MSKTRGNHHSGCLDFQSCRKLHHLQSNVVLRTSTKSLRFAAALQLQPSHLFPHFPAKLILLALW